MAQLAAIASEWPRTAADHEVVYIGQAFGREKERTAWDRLKRHETVQRILAETTPDKQVWLTLAAITDTNLSMDVSPESAEVSDEEDLAHGNLIMATFEQGTFKKRHAVALAEAGLIRMFEPHYNTRLKSKFPAGTLASLESVRPLDLSGVVIELQGWDIGMRYGSSVRKMNQLHFAGFMIHQDQGRSAPITLQPNDDLVVYREK
ncbi:hypothetical protein QFW96_23200 [Saccharopolyspora sp. TS4A08]|uniref:Uncharacterized protein n=1 Tax=Saccharopolyspora ipomoeae TaxID=3042027 RepID=A0ABT6PU71_9PSEU|nr:hypothetical protein [Saccharopolyspora sp. TS4A08]MDI2031554.1 hypothetical protein [Saccharopolyspora sp. TS4A08]